MQDMIESLTDTEIEQTIHTVGTIVAYWGEVIPDGWLPCDHRMLRRNTHPNLFRILGTQYGDGDGSNTAFNLPDKTSEQENMRYIIFVSMVDGAR